MRKCLRHMVVFVVHFVRVRGINPQGGFQSRRVVDIRKRFSKALDDFTLSKL